MGRTQLYLGVAWELETEQPHALVDPVDAAQSNTVELLSITVRMLKGNFRARGGNLPSHEALMPFFRDGSSCWSTCCCSGASERLAELWRMMGAGMV